MVSIWRSIIMAMLLAGPEPPPGPPLPPCRSPATAPSAVSGCACRYKSLISSWATARSDPLKVPPLRRLTRLLEIIGEWKGHVQTLVNIVDRDIVASSQSLIQVVKHRVGGGLGIGGAVVGQIKHHGEKVGVRWRLRRTWLRGRFQIRVGTRQDRWGRRVRG